MLMSFLKGSDDIMVIAIGFYTGNSVTEKAILGYFNAKNGENKEDNNG